jgi:hypothetical protein
MDSAAMHLLLFASVTALLRLQHKVGARITPLSSSPPIPGRFGLAHGAIRRYWIF